MALGAQSTDVIRLIMWDGTRMLSSGILIGILGSLGVSYLLRGQLFQVSPNDPATSAAVVILSTGVTLIASYLPARCAASIDPVRALMSNRE
jgi:ABC-type lipoprotein release transport system permease subunit